METYLRETVSFLQNKIETEHDILLILGSGFGRIVDKISVQASISYQDIPHFMRTNAPTHDGNLVSGKIAEKNVLIMQGRFHIYEGYEAAFTTYPVRVSAELGVKLLITTNLSGGINQTFNVGDFMVVEDHIHLSGPSPLIWGVQEDSGKFTDMYEAYSPRLIALCEKSVAELNISLHRGVLAYLTGPAFETRAELRMLKTLGADAVGWSLVPEALEARRRGIDVLGLACISDISNPEKMVPVDLEELYQVGSDKADTLFELLEDFIGRL
tara:strand:- start:8081 stop:8890 length:810 start_codon:yes stop_codon:yes gene_type:complete